MGSLLAGARSMGSVASGRFLGTASDLKPQGHRVDQCPQDAGLLPLDRSRQRVAIAYRVVQKNGDGGSSRGRRGHSEQGHSLQMSRQALLSQGISFLTPEGM